MKKQKRVIGDVLQINFGDNLHSYARVLGDASFAVYDCLTDQDLQVEQILEKPILFRVAVMDYAVKNGRWKIIGHAPLSQELAILPPTFIQDPISKDSYTIYQDGKMRPASRDECFGLERAAVWDPKHVEDRIRDHFAGSSNKWVESLKLK